MLAIAAVVLSCNTSAIKSNTIKDFMPGKYVLHETHEMGEEWDTLDIAPVSVVDNTYEIVRNWRYERKDGTVKTEKDKKRKAIYDEENMVLRETKSGRVISFAPEKNILLSETREFKKIK